MMHPYKRSVAQANISGIECHRWIGVWCILHFYAMRSHDAPGAVWMACCQLLR